MAAPTDLRLYVYLITQQPLRLEIVFPNEQLARRYRSSVEDGKIMSASRQKSKTVAVQLPYGVAYVETNRSLGGFVLHFDNEKGAASWTDAVCRPIKAHPRQILVKQYWSGEDELEREIAAMAPKDARLDIGGGRTVPLPTTNGAGGRSDRAGRPPRGASPSHSSP